MRKIPDNGRFFAYHLKGTQSALRPRYILDTSFLTLKKGLPQPEIKGTRRVYLKIRINLCSVLRYFQSFTKEPVLDCAFVYSMIIFYHIWFKTLWIASSKEHG